MVLFDDGETEDEVYPEEMRPSRTRTDTTLSQLDDDFDEDVVYHVQQRCAARLQVRGY